MPKNKTEPAKPAGITFQAVFVKAGTLPDGGWRLTLDVDESEAQAILSLSQMTQTVFQVAVIPIEYNTKNS